MTPLRRRMIEDLRIRNYSPKTITAYTQAVARFAAHFGRSPDELGAEQVREYQLHLLFRKASWSTFNICVSGLKFFYGVTLGRIDVVQKLPYGKKPRSLPTVLSRAEVLKFVTAPARLRDRVLLSTAYACGLRVSELRVLSRVFCGKFLAEMTRAFESGGLKFFGDLTRLAAPSAFAAWRAEQAREAWCVYSKPPVQGPDVVLKYLARYVDRVAISNQRLLSLEAGHVTFRYKNYRQKGRQRQKTITLPAEEFLRRFLMHVLPPGFQKVRSYGLLANASREAKLARCRAELAVPLVKTSEEPRNPLADAHACPHCGQTAWKQIEWKPRPTLPERLGLPIPFWDTS